MTHSGPIHEAPLLTRILQGAGLAAALTVFRVFAGFGPRRSPSTILIALGAVALGGGAGGAVYYATDSWRAQGGVRRTFANVGSLLAYCLATGLMVVLVYFLGALPE